MELNWRKIGLGVVAAVVVSALAWAIYTFAASEPTQMLRVQETFLRALEKKKWSTVDAMICKDYADEWGQGPEELKGTMRQLLGGFILLSIDQQIASTRTASGLGFVKARIKVQGTGAGMSGMVVNAANGVKEPWFFHWHKRGRWPWSWELVQIHNDDLRYGKIKDVQ